ncbi:hypothetical protein ISN44_As12g033020 [Arabidopsis suecica]|uniref:Uncharacterized protein n=1 Tax=Arabidopsis suecica TaxID=45249 RepID=A0A8T1YPA2_ARASU|nr:hypothetical protein ISN44_As12g033020 [Arabidopsis suecica]
MSDRAETLRSCSWCWGLDNQRWDCGFNGASMSYGVRSWLLDNKNGAQECVVKVKMVNKMVHQRSVLRGWTEWVIRRDDGRKRVCECIRYTPIEPKPEVSQGILVSGETVFSVGPKQGFEIRHSTKIPTVVHPEAKYVATASASPKEGARGHARTDGTDDVTVTRDDRWRQVASVEFGSKLAKLRLQAWLLEPQASRTRPSYTRISTQIGNLQTLELVFGKLLILLELVHGFAHGGWRTFRNLASSSFVSFSAVKQHFTEKFQRALSRTVFVFVNALNFEPFLFIGEEGWHMANTCHASSDTWRSWLYPRQITLNKWRSIPYACHIRRDTWRNTLTLIMSIATNGDGLRPSSNRLRQMAVNSNSRQIGSPDWRRASTLVTSVTTNGEATILSSNRFFRLAENFHPCHVGYDKWRSNHTLVLQFSSLCLGISRVDLQFPVVGLFSDGISCWLMALFLVFVAHVPSVWAVSSDRADGIEWSSSIALASLFQIGFRASLPHGFNFIVSP